MQAFWEKTDEDHPMTVNDLIAYLAEFGISAERKTIYDDIEALRIFGLDIVNRREKPAGFYLADRDFELAELKLLVDAVQSSKFITYKKSHQLIRKLEGLTSVHEARKLQRQVFVESRVKTMNESIYYNIDLIHTAISENRQISFQYYEWTVSREMRLRRNGERYRISPWELIWKNENYYLIGLDEKSGIVKHYRVDKMLKLSLEKTRRNGEEIFRDFDAAAFASRTFGMFGGKEETVRLLLDNHFIGVIMDHFGKDVMVHREDDTHFSANIHVNVSNQFFGWLTGLGPGVQITAPDSVRKEYQEFLQKAMENYREEEPDRKNENI
jgi:predicted DNA-binding transcriptional regulator YafY